MSWYNEAIFYHIYPLGLTGAPKHNDYSAPVSRLNTLLPWIDHIREIGCTALYIGPLFESVGHGYETTDYKKLDSRLGTNEDLKNFVAACHEKEIKVIFDGVFNHTGRLDSMRSVLTAKPRTFQISQLVLQCELRREYGIQ